MLRAHRDTAVVAGLGLAWYALPHLSRGALPEMLGIPLVLAFALVLIALSLITIRRQPGRNRRP